MKIYLSSCHKVTMGQRFLTVFAQEGEVFYVVTQKQRKQKHYCLTSTSTVQKREAGTSLAPHASRNSTTPMCTSLLKEQVEPVPKVLCFRGQRAFSLLLSFPMANSVFSWLLHNDRQGDHQSTWLRKSNPGPGHRF